MTRNRIRAASFLAAAFLVLGGLALQQQARASAYRRLLSAGYQHAFAELTDQLEGLNSALQKGRYATSPVLLSSLCAEVYSRASAAQAALGELPYSNMELGETAAFLAKTGDYAYALSRQTVAEGAPSETEREALAGLAQTSRELTRRIGDLREGLNDKALTLENVLEAEKRLSSAEESPPPAGSSFEEVEKEFPELPTLLYDGPFSEHLANPVQRYLEGKSQVSGEEAQRLAGRFLDLDPSLLTLTSAGGGRLPTYGFSLDTDAESLWLEVSQQGGVAVELLISRLYGEPRVSREAALAIARDFLAERGFSQMRETYTITQGCLFTVNFAYLQDGVLCYPDLIKVTVALDAGEVTGFEAQGYLTHHTARDLPSPSVTAEQAQDQVAPELSVLSHQLALIPTAGQSEILCHEFKCENAEGGHVLVYVNAQTGVQEKILLLLEDENGTLVL